MEEMTEFERMLLHWVKENSRSLPYLKGLSLDSETPTGYLVTCYPSEIYYSDTTIGIEYTDLFLWLYRKLTSPS